MSTYGDVSDGSPSAGDASFPTWQQPGEQVLWTGRPDPRVLIARTAAAGIVVGLIFITAGVFWEHLLGEVTSPTGPGGITLPAGIGQAGPAWFSDVSSGARNAMKAAGLLPVLLGAWLVIGRPVRDTLIRRHTSYVITDRRAVSMTRRRMVDTPLPGQPATIRRSRAGRVSADLGTPVPHYSSTPGAPTMDGMPGPSSTTVRYVAPVTFRLVADADAMIAALGRARSGEAA
jgi:hypothetical protein